MDTVGSSHKTSQQQMDSAKAEWHKLIHGSANAHKVAHGIHGGTHTREVLILPRSLRLEESGRKRSICA
jgi:hypothetical protein